MMREWPSLIGIFLALALCAPVSFVASAAGVAVDAQRSKQSPQEVLDDGLDALEDNQTASARKLFDHLIASHPGTAEAGRAALELEVMGDEGVLAADEGQARGTAPRGFTIAPDRVAELRRTFLTNVGDRVFFAENSADIGGRSRAVIDHQARWLNKHDGLILTLIGRADDGGQGSDAVELSHRRADAVRTRLIAGGLDANSILIDARGDRDPLALCRTALCQAQNRHVETVIGDPKQAGETRRTMR